MTLFNNSLHQASFIKLSGQRTQTSATSWRILEALDAMEEIVTGGLTAGFVQMSPLNIYVDV